MACNLSRSMLFQWCSLKCRSMLTSANVEDMVADSVIAGCRTCHYKHSNTVWPEAVHAATVEYLLCTILLHKSIEETPP